MHTRMHACAVLVHVKDGTCLHCCSSPNIPLLLMPEVSLGLPGGLFFAAAAAAAAAASRSAFSALSFATCSHALLLLATHLPPSDCCTVAGFKEVCNPKLFVPHGGLEGRLGRLYRPVPIHTEN